MLPVGCSHLSIFGQVDDSEKESLLLLRECLIVRSSLKSKERSRWEPVLRNKQLTRDFTLVPRSDIVETLCKLLTKLSREPSCALQALCLDVLELHRTIDAATLLDVAQNLTTEHSPDSLLALFIGVLCVMYFRNIDEICSRLLYKLFDIICKRKASFSARYFLIQLLITYQYSGEDVAPLSDSPSGPQYELFQRIIRQVCYSYSIK